jgi:hypothetical protein
MKVFIKYLNNKVLLNTKKYQSIKSIINDYIIETNINDEIDNFYLDYNGNYLNLDNSLEKYNIQDDCILTLNKKLKGGEGGFFKYFMKNKLLVFILMVIAFMPVFLLPMGFFPVLSSLIKVIIDKSLDSISKYLICDLGKVTLVKRFRFLTFFIKYVIFILIVYVMITLPLIILCVTLKGHSIKDDPKSMCKPINVGSTAGLILTIIYFLIYSWYRFGNYIINPIISFFKKFYVTDVLFVPILTGILNLYNNIKYLPINLIPYVGGGIYAYLNALSKIPEGFEVAIASILDIGCRGDFSKLSKSNGETDLTKNKKFMKIFNNIINKNNNPNITDKNIYNYEINIKNNDDDEYNKELKINIDTIKKIKEKTVNPICINDDSECCNPKFFITIGERLEKYLNNPVSESLFKKYQIYPSVILLIQSLYEYGLDDIDDVQQFYSSNIESKKRYLQKIFENNSNKLSKSLKILIKDYLNNDNTTLLEKIKNNLEGSFKDNNLEKKFYLRKIDKEEDPDLKKFYLQKIIDSNKNSNNNNDSNENNKIPEDTMRLIMKYIKGDYLEIVEKIKEELYKVYPVDGDNAQKLRDKITNLDKRMLIYAKNENSTYIPGDSLFKTIMKNIYINAYCNILSTTKTSNDVVNAMGKMFEVVDTLKAGTVSGIFLSMYYFLTYIILIICAIFKVF